MSKKAKFFNSRNSSDNAMRNKIKLNCPSVSLASLMQQRDQK